MGDDGRGENHGAVERGALDKMVHRVVISHEYTEGIVSGNGEKCPCDAHGEPVAAVGEEIHHVLDGSKAEAHEHCIYDAVEMLVKLAVVAQDIPQGQQLETFLDEGGHEE